MLELAALAIALGLVISLVNWRTGVLVCLVAGFLQDPLRKMVPGEPVHLTVLVGVFFAVTFLAALRYQVINLNNIPEWKRSIRIPVVLFVVLVVAQSIHTLVRFGNPVLAGLGMLAYLSPFPALLLGYFFARNTWNLRRFLVVYVGLSLLAVAGVYLGFLGFDWSILRQVGSGITITVPGMNLEAHAGFLRSPEIAAWHAATAVCFLVILAILSRKPEVRIGSGLLILFLVGAGLLTGRRKMLVEIVVFVSAYWFLLAYFGRGARKVAAVAVVAGVVGTGLAVHFLDAEQTPGAFNPYFERGVTGFGDAPERFRMLGLSSVKWAVRRHGLLGAGAGAGSQGAQHFGGGAALVGGAAEGGLGKIVVELGVPGVFVLLWVGFVIFRPVWASVKSLGRTNPAVAALGYGLLAFQAANAITFIIASQVFGDLFVLLILGWTMGFVLMIPRLARGRPLSVRRPERAQTRGGVSSLPLRNTMKPNARA